MNGLPFSAAATTHRVLSRIFKWLVYQSDRNAYVTKEAARARR